MRRVRHFLLIALAVTGVSLIPSAPISAAAANDWLWLSSHVSGCTWTADVTWSGYKGSKTLEVYLSEGYDGAPLVPTFVRVKNQQTTATVTLPPLAPSTTLRTFYVWAQLLDTHGNPIPGSLDFTGQSLEYCTAP